MYRLWIICLAILTCFPLSFGADPELDAYDAAAKALSDRFYERAEQQFAEFVQRFPPSTNKPKALLYQAQALHFSKKYDAAVSLLATNLPSAGTLADEYLFWQAESLLEKGDFNGAVTNYTRLLADHPQSNMALQAALSRAVAFHRQKNFEQVVKLLQAPESDFQKASKSASNSPPVIQGNLLLGESLLALNKPDEAKAHLASIPPTDNPALDWEKNFLLARAEFAGAKPEGALPVLTNAIAIAVAANRPGLQAQSMNLQAEVFKKLDQPQKAIDTYDALSTAPNLPVDQRRLALLKAAEMLVAQKQITSAVERVEKYLANNPQEPSADLLRIKAGELWLQQFQSITGNDSRKLAPAEIPAATNLLTQARNHFTVVISQFTNSPHLGKAFLNNGWTLWEEGAALANSARIVESKAAFQNAIEKLTRSDDQALARFKLGDAHFYLKEFPAAATNYLFVLQNYADLPQAKTSLFDKTYQQLVRTYLELGDVPTASKFLSEMRQAFPNNPRTEESLFYYGRILALRGKLGDARAVLEDFSKTYSQSPLLPEVRFAFAKSFSNEGNWAQAIAGHEQWLQSFTNSPLKPEVEFQRAWAYDQSRNHTNAFALFTNFVQQFPTHTLAPVAQNWVADYYFEQQKWSQAEQNYQRIFQNTNWQGSPLAYPAKMMAARTAFSRQGYADAKAYLTNMIQDPGCPEELRPEAWFGLGDVILEQEITGSTNKLNNFIEAANVFDRITKLFPTNRIAPMAWGKFGDCHLQLATQYPDSADKAVNAYRTVLEFKGMEIPVAVLNQAEFGLGIILEKIALTRASPEKEKLLKEALGHLLNVVYGNDLGGRRSDPVYIKKAGLEAIRVCETVGDRKAALELYRRLTAELPALKSILESRMSTLERELAAR